MPTIKDVVREATQEYGYFVAERQKGVIVLKHPHREEFIILRGKNSEQVGKAIYRSIQNRLNSD